MQLVWTDQQELEFLLAHPFCGADGTGDEGGDAGDAGGSGAGGDGSGGDGGEGGEGGLPDGKRKPGDTGDPKGEMIPKHRFDQVNTGYQEYKGLGSAKELKDKLARLEKLEKMPQNRHTEQEAREIESDLMRVAPWLGNLKQQYELQKTNFTSGGAKLSSGFAKEIGIEASDDNHHFITELVGAAIFKDKELTARFFGLDNTVFKDAWAVVKGNLWKNNRQVPGLGLAGKKTGAPPPKPGTKPKEEKPFVGGALAERDLLDAAGEEAFAKISEQM